MKTTFYLFLVLFLCLQNSRSQELPPDAVKILEKLEGFETAERAKTDGIIAEKRNSVGKFLQQILKRETKAGNLDAALATKEMIAKLSQNTSSDTKNKEPVAGSPAEKLPKSKREFEQWLETVEFVDTKMIRFYANERIFSFSSAGKQIGDPIPAKIEGTKIQWIWEGDGKTTEFDITVISKSEATSTTRGGKHEVSIQSRDPNRR